MHKFNIHKASPILIIELRHMLSNVTYSLKFIYRHILTNAFFFKAKFCLVLKAIAKRSLLFFYPSLCPFVCMLRSYSFVFSALIVDPTYQLLESHILISLSNVLHCNSAASQEILNPEVFKS